MTDEERLERKVAKLIKSTNRLTEEVSTRLSTPTGAFAGFLQSPDWKYESNSEVWSLLWDSEVEVKSDSAVLLSIMGHWKMLGDWAYLGAMVDGQPIHPAPHACSGATFTQHSGSHPIGYTVSHRLDEGMHRLGVGVVVNAGTTVRVSGVRLYYLTIPE